MVFIRFFWLSHFLYKARPSCSFLSKVRSLSFCNRCSSCRLASSKAAYFFSISILCRSKSSIFSRYKRSRSSRSASKRASSIFLIRARSLASSIQRISYSFSSFYFRNSASYLLRCSSKSSYYYMAASCWAIYSSLLTSWNTITRLRTHNSMCLSLKRFAARILTLAIRSN